MDETVWYASEGWNSISTFDCWAMSKLSCSSQKKRKKWKGKLIIMIEAKLYTVKNIKLTNDTKGYQVERIPSLLIKNHNKLKNVGYETSQESCYNEKQRFLVLKYISRQELKLRVIALHFFEKQKTFTWWLRSLKKKKKRKVLSSRNFLPILLSSDYTDLWYKIIVTYVVWAEQKELKQRRMMKELKQRRMMKEEDESFDGKNQMKKSHMRQFFSGIYPFTHTTEWARRKLIHGMLLEQLVRNIFQLRQVVRQLDSKESVASYQT